MANVKNYGLTGVSSDLQYGKAGGRIKFDGGAFSFVESDGSTPVKLAGAQGTGQSDYITLSQLEAVQSGLDLKDSVRVATAAALPAYTAAGSGVGKTLTANATGVLTVDGVATVLGDRILVKDEAASHVDHGIYEVTTEGDGTTAFVLTRAEDADGSPSNEVTTGMHTFVSEGTDNSGSGWVLITSDTITVDTTALQFTQFSGSSTYSAANGVELSGSTFRLDIDSLGDEAGTVIGTDTLALGDGSAGGPDAKATLTKIMDDLNIVNVSDWTSGIEFIANSGADTYTKYSLVASAVAGDEGLSVTQNGSDIEFGLDITGLTAVGTSDGADEIVLFDGINNRKSTITDLLADNNIANLSSNGIAVRTAAGTYAARTITPSAANAELGITITDGDGVAGNPTVGLDVTGLTDIGTDVVAGTDYMVVYDTSVSTNRKVSVQEIVDLANDAVSTNSISQGDTSITATDTGTDGTLTFDADGITQMTIDSTGGTITSLAVSDLTSTRVTFAGTGGELTDDAELTYTVGTNTLNAANIDSSGNIGAATIQTDGAGITVTSTGTISTDTGNISSTSGDITTGGSIFTTGTGSITAANGLTDSTLTVAGGVTYSDASGNLTEAAGFTFDGTTLTVPTLDATSVGATDTLVQFGNASGGLADDAGFSFDGATDKILTLGNLDINGTDQVITGNTIDGDISIVPNGTGEVIIGSTGAGVLGSEAAQSMTISGDTDLFLDSNSGDTYIRNGSTPNNVAVFSATADADRWFTFSVDDNASTSPLEIGTGGGDSDIAFVLGTTNLLLVEDAASYETALGSAGDGALVTKGYVEDQISTGASQGSIQTRMETVDLAVATTTAIGAALPAGAVIVRVTVNVGTASDATTSVDIGDGTTADKYMSDAEIDAEVTGTYVADGYFLEGSAVTVTATVATPSTGAASAVVVVEYRVPTA